MSYTMDERTAAQAETFRLKKQGFKAVRIVEKVEIDVDKDDKPIYSNVLISFGYTKDKTAPKEIMESDIDKYNFMFIYNN